jgi:hypothetical protein
VTKLVHDRVIGRVKQASRFVLTDQAAQHIGNVIRDVPDLLVREQQFARAPHDITWIEWNSRALWETINREQSDQYADGRMGFLIDHGTVYTFVEAHIARATNAGPLDVRMMPFIYELHQPWTVPEMKAFCELGGLPPTVTGHLLTEDDEPLPDIQLPTIDYLYWGSRTKEVDIELIPAFRQHSMRRLPTKPPYSDHDAASIIGHCAGDLRNLIAMLLMLNRPNITEYERELPHWRGFVRGKLRPFMSHTTVTININPTPILRKIGTVLGESEPRRRHEVRGTWCHDDVYYKGARAGCIHAWIPHPAYAEDIEHLHIDAKGNVEWSNYQCTECQGHRYWRKKHERGDASKGFVIKDYTVTSRGKE